MTGPLFGGAMRKGIFAAGIAVLVIGGIIAGISFAAYNQSEAIPSTATGSLLVLTPPLLGSGTVTVTWSDASSQFRFSIYQCADSSCSSFSKTSPLANGAGSSGSTSFTGSGGTSYVLVPSGNSNAVPATVDVSGGLTYLLLVGIIIAAVGAVISFVGFRAKAKPKVVYEEDAGPKREMFSLKAKPFTGVQEGPAATTSGERPEYRPETDNPSGPVFFTPGEGEESYGSNAPPPSAPAAGARPPIKCSTCGTMNEPWITNCRNCRRPLSSTG